MPTQYAAEAGDGDWKPIIPAANRLTTSTDLMILLTGSPFSGIVLVWPAGCPSCQYDDGHHSCVDWGISRSDLAEWETTGSPGLSLGGGGEGNQTGRSGARDACAMLLVQAQQHDGTIRRHDEHGPPYSTQPLQPGPPPRTSGTAIAALIVAIGSYFV